MASAESTRQRLVLVAEDPGERRAHLRIAVRVSLLGKLRGAPVLGEANSIGAESVQTGANWCLLGEAPLLSSALVVGAAGLEPCRVKPCCQAMSSHAVSRVKANDMASVTS
jgi:hypothetical protein